MSFALKSVLLLSADVPYHTKKEQYILANGVSCLKNRFSGSRSSDITRTRLDTVCMAIWSMAGNVECWKGSSKIALWALLT